MPTKTLSWLLLALVAASPALARDPANPDEPIAPTRYSPIVAGTKSFRPVEPLPWGDINRRVAPPDAKAPFAPGQGKSAPKSNGPKGGPHGQH